MRLFVILIISVICLISCQKNSPKNSLNHHVYVWQRVWTPSLDSSIIHSATAFHIMHILVSEMEINGKITDVKPDFPFLASNKITIIPVFRINGQTPDSSWNSLIDHITVIVKQIIEQNVAIQGIEIDYDCASSKLDKYSTVLHKIRQSIDSNLTLSITALPSWIGNSNLYSVLKETDFSVLQVHSVIGPQNGIFNNRFAFDNIIRYESITPVPFRVALPAYSSLIQFDDNGKAVAVENENVRPMKNRSEAREYEADPVIVNNLINKLSKKTLTKLKGFVWFRLPVAEDKRSWEISTLFAVVNNEKLYSHLELISNKRNGIIDLKIKNEGNIDAMLSYIDINAENCSIEEPLSYFSIEKEHATIRFTLHSPLRIKAGCTIPVGWLKCDTIKELTIHEYK